jgi:hypothetical protein
MLWRVSHNLACATLTTLFLMRPAEAANSVPVCTNPGTQKAASAVACGNGRTIVVWTHKASDAAKTDIYAQCIDSTGSVLWADSGIAVCADTVTQSAPSAVTDGEGGAIVVWVDLRNGLGNRDLYAQRIDSAGDCLWTTNGVPVCDAAEDQIGHDVVADGEGGAIVVFEDERLAVSHTNIFAQRIDPSGARLWGADGVAVCDTSIQMFPRVTSDGAGGAIITWGDGRSPMDGTKYDIYAQRVNAAGLGSWEPANGVQVTDAENGQVKPAIASDGQGGAAIIWEDHRPGSNNDDIYAQHVDSTGTLTWQADDVPVCTTAGYQNVFRLIGDGAGGAIAVWDEPPPRGMYAQRLGPDGEVLWGVGGRPVVELLDRYTTPEIVSDGAEGVIVVWTNRLPGGALSDVFAQRLNSSGEQMWGPEGVHVTTDSSEQNKPVVVPDGRGGAVIAWNDYRNAPVSGYDIYTQGLDSDGERTMGTPPVQLLSPSIHGAQVTCPNGPSAVSARLFLVNGARVAGGSGGSSPRPNGPSASSVYIEVGPEGAGDGFRGARLRR